MNRPADTIFWIRTVALLAVAGVAVSLVLQGAAHLIWVLAGLALFAAALPWWPWIRPLAPEWQFAVMMGQAVLATVGQFLSGQPGTLILLFFVLLSCCARLPRRYSLLCYPVFSFLACLPYFLVSDPLVSWSKVAGLLPGFLAMIAFAEGLVQYQAALQANQKLLDELVAAQRRNEVPTVPGSGSASFTRRDKEVLSLIAMGFSNKEIAERLFLAEGTVKNRVSQLLEKIGARDRTQAALRARDLELL